MLDLKLIRDNPEAFDTTCIADTIEEGKYGHVDTGALVLYGEELNVFGMGSDSEATTVGMVLHTGLMKMLEAMQK